MKKLEMIKILKNSRTWTMMIKEKKKEVRMENQTLSLR
jgi:hypothetical protein